MILNDFKAFIEHKTNVFGWSVDQSVHLLQICLKGVLSHFLVGPWVRWVVSHKVVLQAFYRVSYVSEW